MTLDEAIMRFKSNAEHEREHGSPNYLKSEQLCKWLKELKAYREIIEQWKHDQISDFYILRALSEVTE